MTSEVKIKAGQPQVQKAPVKAEKKEMTVAFIGNPNCGKTTLFNAYTGANLKVANWPGVTVEKVEGAINAHGYHIHLVDLPGTYSLTSYTMEEQVSRNFILSDDVDVIVDVIDASALERNLYLTLQLLELGKPVVVALNMMDIVEKRGMEIDLHRLPEMLGVPVIPVSALKRRGLSVLLHAAVHHKDHVHPDRLIHNHSDHTHHQHNHHSEFAMVYSDAMEDRIDAVRQLLHDKYPDLYNHRWHALKLIERDPEITAKYPVDDVHHVLDRSYETDIITEKYAFIEEIIHEVVVNQASKAAATDSVDRYLTDKWLGIPIFLAIMAILTWLAWWQKAYLALPIFLVMTTVITYLIVTFQVLVPFYQYRSAQSLVVLNDAAPVYFFEEYRTSYPYYTGQTAYWTAPADYDENARLQRDAVWAKKHVYPTASEDQVLSSLNQHQNLTLVVPEGKYKDYKASEFFSLTRKVGRIGPYYIFKPSP